MRISPDKIQQLQKEVGQLSNHERMMLKKIARGGAETRSRKRRQKKSIIE